MTFHYSLHDIVCALQDLGLKKGDVVFSHSNVGFLGRPENGLTAQAVFNTILQAFLKVIGDEGTLIVPTFTFSFARNEVYDPDHTPSNCGVFAELLRKLPSAYRSHDPCFSVAAVGARAVELTQNAPINSYGPDSFFDRLYKANGTICNINFDAASTFLHYVEKKLHVPYRADKTFSGIFQKNGKKEVRLSTIYTRNFSPDFVPAYDKFSQLAKERGFFHTAKVGRGFIGAILTKDIFDLVKETLLTKPLFLTKAEYKNFS